MTPLIRETIAWTTTTGMDPTELLSSAKWCDPGPKFPTNGTCVSR